MREIRTRELGLLTSNVILTVNGEEMKLGEVSGETPTEMTKDAIQLLDDIAEKIKEVRSKMVDSLKA